jgi:hypothetical protein
MNIINAELRKPISHLLYSNIIYVINTNLMHYLSSVYFINQPLHVLGIFVAHHQEVYYIYIYIGIYKLLCVVLFSWLSVGQLANRQSTEKHITYQFLYMCIYIYSIPPDDGLQICPKHVEVGWRNKLRINSASIWFLLHRYMKRHGQQNMKSNNIITILPVSINLFLSCFNVKTRNTVMFTCYKGVSTSIFVLPRTEYGHLF